MSKGKRQQEIDSLIAAAMGKNTDLLAALLPTVNDVDANDSDGMTALMAAAAKGREQNVELLLTNSANVHQSNLTNNGVWERWTALSYAARNGHAHIVQRLLAAKAEINGQNAEGETALMLAAFQGHSEVVATLLAAGANTSLQNQSGETAYNIAIKMGQLAIAEMIESKR